MRTIAVLKECTQQEKELLFSAVRPEDELRFFTDEQDFLNSGTDAEIIFGEPGWDIIASLKHLRWVQMTWAGANKYTEGKLFPPHVKLTSASGAFGGVISEHILAGVLSLYKNLCAYQAQLQRGLWQPLGSGDTLEGKRALIVGTGDIGTETAKKLKCFGAHTVGICRTQHSLPAVFDEGYPVDSLDGQLPKADLVILALPGTEDTRGLFCAERIGNIKPGAVVVNVGRGFVVDTQALTCALEEGRLGGAVLDVTDPEPLPADHRLRHMENVILTPHVSGISWGENNFTKKRILEIFCENLTRDSLGKPLKNEVNLLRGY